MVSPRSFSGNWDAHNCLVAANIEEFMKMVAVGLAGASPHMISATVTAISRLIFEFKGKIKTRFPFRYLIFPRFHLGLVARRNLEDHVRIPFVPKPRNC
jgi:hypothetical protein